MFDFYRTKAGKIFGLLSDSLREFRQNDPLRMAASTSFFATFALPPILIILIEIFGLFGDPQTIRRDLFEQLSQAIDRNTVSQIRETLRNVRLLSLNKSMEAGGFVFLLFVATTLFTVITSSLNQLWNIRRKKNNGITFIFLYRAKSIGMIIMAGVLFFFVLLGDTKAALLQQPANELGRGVGLFIQKSLYHGISMLAMTTWFILVFRFLADGRPGWKAAAAGGIFTGLLFTIGKILLHLLLSYRNVQTIYGSSTSIVLLLLFIFYVSFIFYYGACFTKIFAERINRPILSTRYAIRYTLKRVQWEGDE
jgi:membrane protein